MATITYEKALELIKKIVCEEQSQFVAAKRLDIRPAYLSDILSGKRGISDNVARKLGYRRVIVYEYEEEK